MNLYIGIDWSERKHDASFMTEQGAVVGCLCFMHSCDGFAHFDATREQFGCAAADCVIGIETAHNLLIDFLWDRGYTQVYVIPPSVVKSKRSRMTTSGARTDRSDATLLAELLRTDRALLHPWRPGSALSRQLRAQVSYIIFLTKQVVAFSNRLRSSLVRYYPEALVVFSDITTQIALAFINAYPDPRQARALTYEQFLAFVDGHRYPKARNLPHCYARLQQARPTASPETTAAYAGQTQQQAQLLLALVKTKAGALRTLSQMFARSPDYAIFASLPGAGEYLAPALAAKFGEDRQRFPSAASVQELAGTCPVTEQSGRRRWVHFRRACDREFRNIAQKWASASIEKSVWAATYYAQQCARGASESLAYRRLANRWLAILWKLWMDNQAYDETRHLQDQVQRRQPQS